MLSFHNLWQVYYIISSCGMQLCNTFYSVVWGSLSSAAVIETCWSLSTSLPCCLTWPLTWAAHYSICTIISVLLWLCQYISTQYYLYATCMVGMLPSIFYSNIAYMYTVMTCILIAYFNFYYFIHNSTTIEKQILHILLHYMPLITLFTSYFAD